MKQEIETYSDEELWLELKSRYNCAVIVYEKDVLGKEEDTIYNSLMWSSGHATTLGLLLYGKKFIELIMDSNLKQALELEQDD